MLFELDVVEDSERQKSRKGDGPKLHRRLAWRHTLSQSHTYKSCRKHHNTRRIGLRLFQLFQLFTWLHDHKFISIFLRTKQHNNKIMTTRWPETRIKRDYAINASNSLFFSEYYGNLKRNCSKHLKQYGDQYGHN